MFVNSIDSVHRLKGILELLRIRPLVLHAHLQQRQRLKNLERFVCVCVCVGGWVCGWVGVCVCVCVWVDMGVGVGGWVGGCVCVGGWVWVCTDEVDSIYL